MCGICGIIDFQKDDPPSSEVLERMSRALENRGPDDHGLHLDRHAGLAIRRLSIIDLMTGHQPLHNEDKSVWLVINGEVYNYKELRRDLQGLGHYFYTQSDAEAVIHAYEQYGQEFLTKLRGMYAFALWDAKRQILLLARDRLGIKPLYYAVLNDTIIFASETRSLFQSGALKQELNLGAIDQFFSFSYVPGPQTIFKNVEKLSPGHFLLFSDRGVQIKEYWQLDYSERTDLSEDECLLRLSGLLEESISLHLRSDVPIGIFLSGGIDSSIITYLASRQGLKPIKTFCLGFDTKESNELGYARLIADRFKTEHYEEIITDKAIDSLPGIVGQLSEPLADISVVPTWFVSKMAGSKVKVILSGEGGDEMFAGYPWYKVSSLSQSYQRLPLKVRRYFAHLIKNRDLRAVSENSYFYRRLRAFFLSSIQPLSGRYLWRVAYFNPEQKQRLFSEEFNDLLKVEGVAKKDYPFKEERRFADFLSGMLYYDTKLFLPDNLLAKMDQMTMAHSLEGRVPFLDHKLVEFVASLPSKMKLNHRTSKYLLRKFISSKVPKEIITRPKQGLMPPVQKWLNSRLDDFFLPVLNDQKTLARGYFNHSFIQQMVNCHKKGKADYSYQIWTLTAFELWLRAFI